MSPCCTVPCLRCPKEQRRELSTLLRGTKRGSFLQHPKQAALYWYSWEQICLHGLSPGLEPITTTNSAKSRLNRFGEWQLHGPKTGLLKERLCNAHRS